MSKIFDALRSVEQVREPEGEACVAEPDCNRTWDRRREERWNLDVPIYVYGHGLGKVPFHEEAHTISVSASGGLLQLTVPVREGQKLLLTNKATHRQHICRIVRVCSRDTYTLEVTVEFPSPYPEMWQVHRTADSVT